MRDDFNLHIRAFGQRGDLDRGTRGKIFREILRVNLVHAREIAEVRQEYRGFHDIGERQMLVVQNGFDVLQHAIRLRFDVAGNQVAVLGINRDLAGAEEQVADADGVIVRADGGG